MIAALFVAPVFFNRGFERWIRWTAMANGIFAISVFLSYYLNNTILGIGWVILVPSFSVLLAIYFQQKGRASE